MGSIYATFPKIANAFVSFYVFQALVPRRNIVLMHSVETYEDCLAMKKKDNETSTCSAEKKQ
jgi:hypothetical protein